MASLIQSSFSKGEISQETYGRVDVAAYKIALRTARNVIIRTQGGVVNRPGLEFVNFATSNGSFSRLRRFRFNTTDTYMLEFSHLTMRVIRNDAFVLEVAKPILGASQARPCVLHVAAHGWSIGDHVEVENVAGMTRLNDRRFGVYLVPDADHVALLDLVTGQPLDSTGYAAYVLGGTAARVYTLATPYIGADLKLLKFVQSASVLTIWHPNYDERKLTRTGHAAWTLTTPTFAPATAAPTGVIITPNSAGAQQMTYAVTATDAETGEESLQSAVGNTTTAATPWDNIISWTGVTGAGTYSVYRQLNGVFGFIGSTPDLAFNDVNLAPALTITPPLARNPFSGFGNSPATGTYWQQRQYRGGSINRPDTQYFSRPGSFYNMSVSQPSQPDDALTAALTSREVNEIRHAVPLGDLIVFTAGTEWRITSSGAGFSADTYDALPQSNWGCSHLEPIVIGITILFVPENQLTVRSTQYAYITNNYDGDDLTLLSNHMFGLNLTLTAWAFGKSPDPIVFGVRSDGTAIALTYQEKQQVVGWARWDTSGVIEDVDVVRPSSTAPDEVPYYVVVRKINGHQVRCIERLHSRRFTDVRDCFFVDCGLSYDNPTPITGVALLTPITITSPGHPFVNGETVDLSDIVWVPNVSDVDTETQPDQLNNRRFTIASVTTDTFRLVGSDGTGYNAYVSGGNVRVPVTTVSAADHLEGREVVILADGNVVEGLTVVNGSVTLPFAASRVHLGLKYISDIETLDIETPQGTIQGKLKTIPSVTVRFNQSRGLFMGLGPDSLDELKQREFEPYGEPTALFSGKKLMLIGAEYNTDGRVFIRQRYPLPMTILDIVPNVEGED